MTATSPNRAVDELLESAWTAIESIEWGIDRIAMNDEIETDDSVELSRISDATGPIGRAVRAFTRYSDGRPIRSHVPITPGVTFIVLWPADPAWAAAEYALHEGMTWDGRWRLASEGRLPVDPGQPDRGGFRVWVDDGPCAVRIEDLPPTPQLEVVR